MTAENTSRHPKGIPAGGQFAPDVRAEPGITLPGQRLAVLAAAAEKHTALAQAEWANSVWEKHPHASFADVHIQGDGNNGPFSSGVDLYDAEGERIELDMDEEARLEEQWDTSWDAGIHAADSRVKAVMSPYSTAFSLDSVKERWAEIQSSPEPATDPFAHLSGMDKARAQSAYAKDLNREATAAYVQGISAKLLAINPDFGRLYVNRKADVESGLSFTLDRVEDIHRNVGDVDLTELEEHGFQDIHLDPFVDYDDATDDLYINIDPGN